MQEAARIAAHECKNRTRRNAAYPLYCASLRVRLTPILGPEASVEGDWLPLGTSAHVLCARVL